MNTVGFAFGTLWQEATKAVGHLANFLLGNSQAKAQVEMNRDTQLSGTNQTFSTNAMLTGAIPMIALILIIVTIIYSKNNKK